MSLTRSGTGIVLEWEGGGSLQTAPAVTGPWSEVRVLPVGCRSRPREGALPRAIAILRFMGFKQRPCPSRVGGVFLS